MKKTKPPKADANRTASMLPVKIDDLIIPPNMPIIEAVKVLNSAHLQIVLIADENRKLLGVISDSNVRRAILDNIDFQLPASTIMVTNPIVAREPTSNEQIRSLMERTQIHEIPILDKDGYIVDLKVIDDILRHEATEELMAVIMVGGLGSRLQELTAETPKPLLDVGGRPILFTLLDQLITEGFSRIYLTLNYKAEMVREAINAIPRYVDIVKFIDENKRMGTAGALRLLPELPSSPFLILNGDLLTKVALSEMVRFHKFERNLLTVALKKERFSIPYGCAEVEGTKILRMREKPEHTALVNTGVYVADPIILQNIPEDSFFDMTDVIDRLLKSNLRVGYFSVHEYWLDIGQPAQLKQAQSDYEKYFFSRKDDD